MTNKPKSQGEEKLKFERVWAMPNKWTFKIRPIKRLLADEGAAGLSKKGRWIDPFAGKYSPADLTNDINPEMPTDFHLDALKFLKKQPDDSFDGLLYDPPYSFTQAAKQYKGYGKEKFEVLPTNKKYWRLVKNEGLRVVKSGGKVIKFGWNSNSFGKKSFTKIKKILLIAHGGERNDTIVTIEQKL